MTTKILTVIGARPQFVKAAALSRVIREKQFATHDLREIILHTGQHYDEKMSKVFFDQLDIPRPDYDLECGGGLHGEMTGKMLTGIESVLLKERPDVVLLYGDTNSTLAGALAAAKLNISIAHVEAGLRSFNMRMPEEINRVLTDHVSKHLFCPTSTAVTNLSAEGIHEGVHEVGDVMYDVALHYGAVAQRHSPVMESLNLTDKCFVLATCHRAENTDDPRRLREILRALASISGKVTVILPLHPRTRAAIEKCGLGHMLKSITVTEPLSYLDTICLERSAKAILTDSGGMQKEAFFYGVPCITMRAETEWVETVKLGRNILCDADSERIIAAWDSAQVLERPSPEYPYGRGDAAAKILSILRP